MRLPNAFGFIVLAFFACSSGQQTSAYSDRPQKSNTYSLPLSYKEFNKKKYTQDSSYYMVTQYTDSTAQIVWGNDSFERTYKEPLNFIFVDRLYVAWANSAYLVLQHSTGTQTWQNIVLPLNKSEVVQLTDNALAFDPIHNILVTEQFGDTVLVANNLKTLVKEFITEKERPCSAVQNSACIDTIIINKILYYKWVTPHKFSDGKQTVERRVRLAI